MLEEAQLISVLQMIDHAFQVLTFHITWKVKGLSPAEPTSDEEIQRRQKLQEQRDMLRDTLDSCALGANTRSSDSVRRSVLLRLEHVESSN